MPIIDINPDDVFASGDAHLGVGTAGESIERGDALYFDDATQTIKLASSNSQTEANFIGVSRTKSELGQPVLFVFQDTSFSIGGDVPEGTTLYLSTTSGAVTSDAPDVGEYVTIIGVGVGISETLTGDSDEETADSTLFTVDLDALATVNIKPIRNGVKE